MARDGHLRDTVRALNRLALILAALGVLAIAVPASAAAAETVPVPSVEGPIGGGTHGFAWNRSLFELRGPGYDYTENEYFYGGSATNLATGAGAPYESRMLVRLPADPDDFNGTVVVEWLNVTAQSDLETAWPVEAQYLMRHGVAYVGVSAQLAGVCCGPTTLQGWDPQRYGSLLHPGDVFAQDIFSQAIAALLTPPAAGSNSADPMQGLRARDVIVTGASQSASMLTPFVNEGYNRGQVDLFVITRGGGPYTDFSTPILQLNEENNEVPQPDNDSYVAWEEAGTAHAPEAWYGYVSTESQQDLDTPGTSTLFDALCGSDGSPVNRGSVEYSTRALSRWAQRYLRTGKMPPTAPRVERESAGGAIVRDANGLAQGGLRQPFVAVPVAFNTSDGCPLFGTFIPWDSEKIESLYPSHADYVAKIRAWTAEEMRKGWLLRSDRRAVIRKANRFRAPWSADGCAPCKPPLGL
jgi:hypothetical protein